MLEIERGRHVKPQKLPLEQRICQRCTSNSVDDEIYFLITCSYFATQRASLLVESKLLNSEFDSLSNDAKFNIYYVIYTSTISNMRLVRLVIPLIILVFRADVSQCIF